ncbi:MAG: nucleotidyltransferase domain-containing protein [Nitrospirae bacterium]|nr:nucleotidyltransferase domain-containing protein [Nitrospirota bacterium]
MKKETKKPHVMSQEKIISILRKEMPYLKDKYGVERIMLYGSFAKGKQNKKSDVDVLVDLRKTLGFEFIALADRLEAKLGRKVDIATFEHFKQSFHSPRYRHVAEDIKRSLIYVK